MEVKLRDNSIDLLRGLCIGVMLGANMTSAVLAGDAPYWFRLISSIPAPLFIFISGMMVKLGVIRRKDFWYFLKRGLFVLSVGIGIDLLVFKSLPNNFDVLYLIGISLPIVYLTQKINYLSTLIGLLVIVFTPWMRHHLGYSFELPDLTFSDWRSNLHIVNHSLVGGWFPIFPWISFALFGADFMRLRSRGLNRLVLFLAGLKLLFLGSAFWYQTNSFREGYLELFYPPTLDYVFTMTGIIAMSFVFIGFISNFKPLRIFEMFGKNSLFLYAFHLAAINWVICKFWNGLSFDQFLNVYAIFFIFTALGIYVKERTKISTLF